MTPEISAIIFVIGGALAGSTVTSIVWLRFTKSKAAKTRAAAKFIAELWDSSDLKTRHASAIFDILSDEEKRTLTTRLLQKEVARKV